MLVKPPPQEAEARGERVELFEIRIGRQVARAAMKRRPREPPHAELVDHDGHRAMVLLG